MSTRSFLLKSASAGLMAALLATPALATDTKVGILFDVTGPIASFIPPMMDAVKLANDEVNAGGGLLDGQMVTVVGDTTGATQGAVDAATKLVNIENVPVVVGALMSGTTLAAANAVTIPAGVTQISPTATSPDFTGLNDNDYVFRIVPSDAYQGVVLAKLVLDQGITTVALTYANNDYATPLATGFAAAYKAGGGTIAAEVKHEEKQQSYMAELGTLAKDKPEALVLIAYAGDSGTTIVKEALENDLFTRFIGTDGLRDNKLIEQIGAEHLKDSFFTSPSAPESEAATKFEALYTAAFETTKDKIFIGQTYDSVMLAALAVEKAGSTDRAKVRDALREVASAPGEKILPGEWAKAKALIAEGKDIDYSGATGEMEFDANGDIPGVIGHFVVEGDGYKQVGLVNP
ncbi:MAG: ABC transporter substrate-binding protein [Rhodospirillaceae bacterium]|nr:ABC transporter substrate-binding protein [Rhodospirillaceae bacterium]